MASNRKAPVMVIAALIVTAVGAALSVWGALWLLFGFRSDDPRYVDDGMLLPGAQRSQVVPNLLEDQRKVSVIVAIGTSVQLVGAVLAVAGAVQ